MSSDDDACIVSETESDASKELKTKAWKWKFFKELKGNPNKIQCKECDQTYSMKTANSNLIYHIEKNHSTSTKQMKMTNFLINKKQVELNSREELLKFIICGMHSFRICEEKHFEAFVASLNTNFKVPSADTIISDAKKLFETLQIKTIGELKNTDSKISLTNDL